MLASALRGLLLAGVLLLFAAPAQAGISALDNGVVRVGVDLDQGGKLTWLSSAGGAHADNLLFEAEQSYNATDWHGYQDPATVVDSSNDGRTLYTRAVAASCACAMQTWITLHGNAVVVRNRLTNFDANMLDDGAPSWQELPALYTAGLGRVVTYEGPHPWTGGRVVDLSPADLYPLFTPQHEDVRATEHWAALVDDSGYGIGLVEPDLVHMIGVQGYLAGVRLEQLDPNTVYNYTYTLVLGTVRQIRAYAYAHRPDPRPSYIFAHDREHFTETNATDNGFPIAGALRVRLDRNDPQLVGPETEWPASRVPRLYVRGAWHTHQIQAQLFWAHDFGNFSEPLSRFFKVIPDGQFRTYRVDLFRSASYRSDIRQLRLDPSAWPEPGGWVDITCISYTPCPVDRRAERLLALDGGRIPFLDPFSTLDTSLWSVTGNSTGAVASVSDGALRVRLAAGAKPLAGQTYLAAGVYSRCTVQGDFDVQVSYSLDDWPAGDDVHLNFSVGNGTLYRAADRVGLYYPPLPGGSGAQGLPPSGTLRLLRTDGVLRGYYRDANGTWIEVGVAIMPNTPANIGLSLSSGNLAATPEAAASFDDFRVVRGVLTCQ